MHISELIQKNIRKLLYSHKKRKLGLRFPLLCKVHGVKTADRQGALRQCQALDALQLVHVPFADYPHNVYVYSIPLNRVLGYLEKDVAEKLVALFGENFCRDGEITEIVGGGTMKYVGCRLRVLESMEKMQNVTDFTHLYGE